MYEQCERLKRPLQYVPQWISDLEYMTANVKHILLKQVEQQVMETWIVADFVKT
jgi:fido (protein-threonine AMPylation protein)